MKRTPFYHQHLALGATFREAQGWTMPDVYIGNREEHLAVRGAAGLVDWSSTGEIEIQGPDALTLIQRVIVNDAAGMAVGQVLYSTMCRPTGAIFSDITVYRLDERRYWIMTAWGSDRTNRRPEFEWLAEQAAGLDVDVCDVSSGLCVLAAQGPRSAEIVAAATGFDLAGLRYMRFVEISAPSTPRLLISRTGFTGELGYELVFPAEHGADVWEALWAAGHPRGMLPVGMQTSFSLRMEKGYIARFDFMDGVSPLEAGLGWTVKYDKGDFIGREALLRQAAAGAPRRLVSVAMLDDALPPMGSPILAGAQPAGVITSSAQGWSVGRPLALALTPQALAAVGTQLTVLIEGQPHPAEIVRRPPYDPEGRRLRG
jgi:aminomethyltransferase